MDAVGSERAAFLADLVDGPTALLFAGTRPERLNSLIVLPDTPVSHQYWPFGGPGTFGGPIAGHRSLGTAW
jgi:hypothetical protein